jgi:hypothetical protein
MDPTDPNNSNPIVAMAMRIRARRDLDAVVDASLPASGDGRSEMSAEASLAAFGNDLRESSKRLNSILGKDGVTFVRLERPLRLRVRFRETRVTLDLDTARELVIVRGDGLDGEYQFDSGSSRPALINLSKLSTEAGYGEALTAGSLLKHVARDARLPRPAHLDDVGPIRY